MMLLSYGNKSGIGYKENIPSDVTSAEQLHVVPTKKHPETIIIFNYSFPPKQENGSPLLSYREYAVPQKLYLYPQKRTISHPK